MISTVTTAVASLAGADLAVLLSGLATATLLLVLVQCELASATGGRFANLSRHMSMAAWPLLITFGFIVAAKIATFI